MKQIDEVEYNGLEQFGEFLFGKFNEMIKLLNKHEEYFDKDIHIMVETFDERLSKLESQQFWDNIEKTAKPFAEIIKKPAKHHCHYVSDKVGCQHKDCPYKPGVVNVSGNTEKEHEHIWSKDKKVKALLKKCDCGAGILTTDVRELENEE